jgi:hypothetical protein
MYQISHAPGLRVHTDKSASVYRITRLGSQVELPGATVGTPLDLRPAILNSQLINRWMPAFAAARAFLGLRELSMAA